MENNKNKENMKKKNSFEAMDINNYLSSRQVKEKYGIASSTIRMAIKNNEKTKKFEEHEVKKVGRDWFIQEFAAERVWGDKKIKGVSQLSNGKWRAYIWVDNKQVHLGFHDTREEAEKARLDGEIKYLGERISDIDPDTVTEKE